jgi:hypothetical protein
VDIMSETVAVKGPNGLTFHFPAETAKGLLRHGDIGNSEVKASDTGTPLIPDLRNDEDAKRAASTNGFLPRADGGTSEGSAETQAVLEGRITEKADGKPAGNAPTADWHAYAIEQGKTEDELDGLGQREIRALFDTK